MMELNEGEVQRTYTRMFSIPLTKLVGTLQVHIDM